MFPNSVIINFPLMITPKSTFHGSRWVLNVYNVEKGHSIKTNRLNILIQIV